MMPSKPYSCNSAATQLLQVSYGGSCTQWDQATWGYKHLVGCGNLYQGEALRVGPCPRIVRQA
jgi:hypothetical protein